MTVTDYQNQFLLQQKRRKRFTQWMRLLILLGFLFLWEAAADLHWIDAFIFSSPSRIWKTFLHLLCKEHLSTHILVTLAETLISFLLVGIFSILISVFLWLSSGLSSILEPYLVVLNSLPKSALAPLLIVWLGANVRTIIAAGMSVAVFSSIISIYSGFTSIDEDALRLIQTLGGTKKDALSKVVLPASIPLLLSVMKVNIGLCLVGVIIGEFIGARQGLGYLIIYSSQVFRLDWLLMSIVLLCLMAYLLYTGLHILEKHYPLKN